MRTFVKSSIILSSTVGVSASTGLQRGEQIMPHKKRLRGAHAHTQPHIEKEQDSNTANQQVRDSSFIQTSEIATTIPLQSANSNNNAMGSGSANTGMQQMAMSSQQAAAVVNQQGITVQNQQVQPLLQQQPTQQAPQQQQMQQQQPMQMQQAQQQPASANYPSSLGQQQQYPQQPPSHQQQQQQQQPPGGYGYMPPPYGQQPPPMQMGYQPYGYPQQQYPNMYQQNGMYPQGPQPGYPPMAANQQPSSGYQIPIQGQPRPQQQAAPVSLKKRKPRPIDKIWDPQSMAMEWIEEAKKAKSEKNNNTAPEPAKAMSPVEIAAKTGKIDPLLALVEKEILSTAEEEFEKDMSNAKTKYFPGIQDHGHFQR